MKDKINVGLFSYGMSGSIFHAPFLHTNPGFSLQKVLQRRGEEAKTKYPYVEIVRSPEELYEDPGIDLIVVNTPDHTHYRFAKESLLAGKHVVVEKPFVQEVHEGEELIELAMKKGKILSVYQSRRYEGDFKTVKKIIGQNLIGRIVDYESHFDRFRNYIRDTWKEKPENKTGILYNLGSHLIDQALQLFGMPDHLFADIRNQRTAATVDDAFDLGLFYDGLKVVLKGSYLVREPGPRFRINGTEGSYVKYGNDQQEAALMAGQLPVGPDWGKDPDENWGILNTSLNGLHFRGRVETERGSYQEFYDNIYEAVVNGEDLAVKPHESLDGIRIIKAAYESSREKKVVYLR